MTSSNSSLQYQIVAVRKMRAEIAQSGDVNQFINPSARPASAQISPTKKNGSDTIINHVEKKYGIKIGQSTPDGKIFLKVEEECLAGCDGGPMMQVDHVYHMSLTPEKVDKILDSLE